MSFLKKSLLWLSLMVACATAAIAQNAILTGNITAPGSSASPFNGFITLTLTRSQITNMCASPVQVLPTVQTRIAVVNGVVTPTAVLSQDCMSPRLPYFISLYDNRHTLIYQDNWYIPNMKGADLNIGLLSATKLTASGVSVAVPQPIISAPTTNQTITQPSGTQLYLNALTMTGPLYLAADPTASNQAATKNYVDTHGGGGGSMVYPAGSTFGYTNPAGTAWQNPTSASLISLLGYTPIGSFTYAGTGTPSATCSSATNNGWFAINATPTAYQCSNATGSYAWNSLGGGSSGVASIDAQTGAFTFSGPGVSHVGNAYTFSGTGSGVGAINGATGANVSLTGFVCGTTGCIPKPDSSAPFCTTVAQSGYITTKKCGNFVYTLDITPGAGGLTINNEFTGNFGQCDTKYAVDSVNGSDSNAGTCNAPFQTLTKLMTVTDVAGDSIGLAAGSHWRSSYEPTASIPNILIKAYGSGTRPEIDGYTVIPNANFTLAAGQTFTYQTTVTIASSSGSGPAIHVDENGAFLPGGMEDSIADTEANAGTWYYSQAACTSVTTCTVYVHPINNTDPITDGLTYEYTGAYNSALLSMGGCTGTSSGTNLNSEISGVWVRGGQLCPGGGNFIHDDLVTESMYHSIYTLENDVIQNLVLDGSYDAKFGSNLGGPLPVINFFNPTGGMLELDGVVINMPATPIPNQSAPCVSYYGHTISGSTTLTNTIINGFVSNNCGAVETTIGTNDYINGVYLMGKHTTAATGVVAYDPNAQINNVIFPDDETQSEDGVITLNGTGPYTITNANVYLNVQSGTSGDFLAQINHNISGLTMTGNTFVESPGTIGTVVTGGNLLSDKGTVYTIGPVTVTNNTFNSNRQLMQLNSNPTSLTSDYNNVLYGGLGFGAKLNNVNYSGTAWRGLGYDTHSTPLLSFNANWGSTASFYNTNKIPTETSGSVAIWAQGTGQATGATLTYLFPTPFTIVPLVTPTYSSISSCTTVTYAAPTVTTSSVTFTTTASPPVNAICQITWTLTP